MRKSSIVLLALLSLVGVSAQAGESDVQHHDASAVVSRTRAEVKQETIRAIRAGEVRFGDVTQASAPIGTSTRTRSEVRAETLMALKERGLSSERGLYAN